MSELPAAITELAAQLAALPGTVAVALGGSRAAGTARPDSDWDLGVYYRAEAPLDPAAVRALSYDGFVSELGEWGPIVNGGAWLTSGDLPVDVLFRDLDRIARWSAEAEAGRFEVLLQNGHRAGAPTYLPVGELAIARVLHGALPRPAFPDALCETAPARWRERARVALLFASGRADLGDALGTAGMLSEAVLCAAHAVLAKRSEWALTEKGLAERAGLGAAQPVFAGLRDLPRAVAAVGELIGIEPLRPRPV
jgi:predicted nucleotidyltransferase